jgi:hypothetical protein
LNLRGGRKHKVRRHPVAMASNLLFEGMPRRSGSCGGLAVIWGSMRNFWDTAGVEWTVFEVRRHGSDEDNWAYLPRGFRSGWLCFESSVGKRRLSPVPDGWKQFDSSELERMLRRASTVGKQARGTSEDGLNFRGGSDREPGAPAQ